MIAATVILLAAMSAVVAVVVLYLRRIGKQADDAYLADCLLGAEQACRPDRAIIEAEAALMASAGWDGLPDLVPSWSATVVETDEQVVAEILELFDEMESTIKGWAALGGSHE